MEDDEHYVDDPKNPQFQHHGGEYAYQGGNSGGDFEGEGFYGEHEGYEASGNFPIPGCGTDNTALCLRLSWQDIRWSSSLVLGQALSLCHLTALAGNLHFSCGAVLATSW